MKNNFSSQVKEIISLSREEALLLGNDFIGTEHLLLGLLREGNNKAVSALQSFNIDLRALRSEVEMAVKNNNGKGIANLIRIPLTEEAENVIRETVIEAKDLKNLTVESEHLLLSILKNKESKSARILHQHGADYDLFRNELAKEKNNQSGSIKLENDYPSNKKNIHAFWQIFLFEIKYRLKRPDTYLYFLVFFSITFLAFGFGNVPASDKTYVNAPIVLTKFFTIFSIFMMVVTAAIMGAPLYRDLEYNTHEYYLSYPITKNDYFWGRFFGSFFFVVIIGSSLVWGSLFGTLIGPKLGWLSANRVGPYHIINYLQPFLVYVVPNLLLTSSIFFGLVAYTRNVKVVYTGGVILYLGYMMSLFIFHNAQNKNIIFILDAFGFVPINLIERFLSPEQKNSLLISLQGQMLMNRIIWSSVGIAIILITYFRFSFIRFFVGRTDKKVQRTRSIKYLAF